MDTIKESNNLVKANKELAFQNEEKEQRAAELMIANKELAFQNIEKEKRAAELLIANSELIFQNIEKGKRAAELVLANIELAFQNEEKEQRAAELLIANNELIFQNIEKGKRAAELVLANIELAFQNEEKEHRAAELIIANKELAFQNQEKEKRAAELIIANKNLVFQNGEKEKRAMELTIAIKELQKAEEDIRKLNEEDIRKLNEELEGKVVERTRQLEIVNSELDSFTYSVSHDLRAPLRSINGFTQLLLDNYINQLDDEAKRYMHIVIHSSKKMAQLIDDLLTFSRLGKQQLQKTKLDMTFIFNSIYSELSKEQHNKEISVHIAALPIAYGDASMIKQVIVNLIGNSLKYSSKNQKPEIEIGSYTDGNYTTFYVKDNGAGFDMKFYDKLFGVFQRLHSSTEFEGTGVGLSIVQRIITKHKGKVWARGITDEGATFFFSLPNMNKAN